MRIGFGYDVHKLVEGRPLIIGGLKIPFERGLLGYSDGDVLLHAIVDALIGAAGEGDIGKHFPPGNPEYKGIESVKLLQKIKDLLDKKGFIVGNVDSTVVLQEPKLAPFIEEMRHSIAKVLDVPASLVNIKAKTEEGLGFTGEGKGVSAYAICMLHKKP
jgi:2-C-methyl-D-erythritol 2,4-cyclodiphosphate synthase